MAQKLILSLWLGLERYQAQHPIPNTLASHDTNTQYQYRYQVSDFTRALYPHSHPWCLCIAFPRFPTICSEAVCPHTAYQIVVARRRRRLLSAQYWVRLLRKVLGRYQYHPILASIGQYPIPQYRYRSNPTYGIPLNTLNSTQHEKSSFTLTLFQSVRKFLIHSTMLLSIIYDQSLLNNLLWGTLLNAFTEYVSMTNSSTCFQRFCPFIQHL